MKKTYNKLVRDRVPEIIEKHGFKAHYSVSDWPEKALQRKLDEEVKEFHDCIHVESELEELADIVEVCLAYAKRLGYSEEQFNSIRLRKKEEKGGFDQNYFLFDVEDEIYGDVGI